MLRSQTNGADLKIIGAFILAGLVVPFMPWPLWWLATRDHPVLPLQYFFTIENIVFPGSRGSIVGWNGPWNWSLIVARWTEALTKNAAIYALVGILIVLIARLPRGRFGESKVSK
jgi:hypothetical protein